MIKNYFKIAFRNVYKHKGFSLINIFGLAVGIACSVVIILYVMTELSYDNYHPDVDRIYRVAEHRIVPLGEFKFAATCGPLARALRENYPEIQHTARALPYPNCLIQIDDKSFTERVVWLADPELFKIFQIPFLQGDPNNALSQPDAVVLTEKLAKKYFGDENPIGKTMNFKVIQFDSGDKHLTGTVTGIVKNSPQNTHLKYNMFVSMKTLEKIVPWYEYEWFGGGSYTYIKLKPNIDRATFEPKVERLAYQYAGEELGKYGQTRTYFLQPIKSIHLNSNLDDEIEPPGKLNYIYIYAAFALLILLIGCMNFVNLSAVRSSTRTKEVALRKVIGAARSQLSGQFLIESFIITAVAFVVGFIILELFLLKLFNEMAGTNLSLILLQRPETLWSLLGLIFLVVIGAGGYPAFILSSFRPTQAFRGDLTPGTRGSFMLKGLVIGQFAIAIFLILDTLAIYRQLEYMQSEKLGFSTEQKIVIPFATNWNYFRKNYKQVKQEFLAHPDIQYATASSTVPGQVPFKTHLRKRGEGHAWPEPGWENPQTYNFLSSDESFIPLYDIPVVAGRHFQLEGANDERSAFLVNEAAMKKLGYDDPEKILGLEMRESFYGRTKRVVGVIKDFHYRGMQIGIEPLVMEFSNSRFRTMTLKVSSQNLQSTIGWIENKWLELFPNTPFHYTFLDEQFNKEYQHETQTGKLIGFLALLGLAITCLGLLGLASFMTQRRTKEIGIRKVLGASVFSITKLFSLRFVLVVLSANIIAIPIGYWLINKWLQNFAYRIELGWEIFAIAGGLALGIALLTVSTQVIRAALANPVESLRYE